jgi:phage shock protein PspC (stress-responsive transcriptional regulator)
MLNGSRTEDAFSKFEILERRADFAEGRAEALGLTGPKSLEEEIAELKAADKVDAELEAMKAALAAKIQLKGEARWPARHTVIHSIAATPSWSGSARLGEQFGIDPTFLRIGFVAAVFLIGWEVALVVYAGLAIYFSIQRKRSVDSGQRMSDFDKMEASQRPFGPRFTRCAPSSIRSTAG